MTTLDRIIIEREAIWQVQPVEIDNILANREQDMPVKAICALESYPRLCSEMTWNFREYYEKGIISEQALLEFFPIFFRHYAKKIRTECNEKILAELLDEVANEAATSSFDEFLALTDQLRIYMARMSLWADLYIPWQVGNAELRSSLS